jgi:hypothetical protein
MSERRTRAAIRSLKRIMVSAVRENEAIRNQPIEYRAKPFTVFAVQAEHWEDAQFEAGRLFALLAEPLGIDLSFLDTVVDWDNAPDEIYERYADLCPIDAGGLSEPECDYLIIKSNEEVSGFIHRGDWIAVLPEMGLTVFTNSAFRTMFTPKGKAKR